MHDTYNILPIKLNDFSYNLFSSLLKFDMATNPTRYKRIPKFRIFLSTNKLIDVKIQNLVS
jgi:hypothetical protein